MIALFIGLVLAFSSLLIAGLARFHPKPLLGRCIQAGALVFGTVSLCIGLALFPSSQAWQADYEMHTTQQRALNKMQHAEQMIQTLGSSRAYIEYLKAERE